MVGPGFRPPPPFFERVPDGSISVFAKYAHEGLNLHQMTLRIYSDAQGRLWRGGNAHCNSQGR